MFISKLYVQNDYRFKKCVLVLLPNVRLTLTFELQSGMTRKKATKHFSNGRMTGTTWRQRWLLAAVEEGAGEQCAQELNNVCSLVSNWRVVWWCPRTSWRMQPCIYYCQIGTGVRWRWLGHCYCCSALVLLGMVTDLVVPLAFNGSFPCFRLLITDEPWLKGSNENCMLHVTLFAYTIPDIWLPICDQRTIWNAARSVDLTVVAVLFLLWSLAIWCFVALLPPDTFRIGMSW